METSEQGNPNMELWERFFKTPIKSTKSFNRGGGFSGTGINGIYIAKRLTEEFGLCGIGWGWDILDESYVEGGPLIIDKVEVCKAVVHKVRLTLWYTVGEKVYRIGPHFGHTDFVGKNKYGVYTDEEAPKKSITDAIGKCASYLGLGGDIFSGLYDDNKYINQLRQEAREAETENKPQPKSETPTHYPEQAPPEPSEQSEMPLDDRQVMLKDYLKKHGKEGGKVWTVKLQWLCEMAKIKDPKNVKCVEDLTGSDLDAVYAYCSAMDDIPI